MVLQGAGDDLRRAGGAFVDQTDQRHVDRDAARLDRERRAIALGVLLDQHDAGVWAGR